MLCGLYGYAYSRGVKGVVISVYLIVVISVYLIGVFNNKCYEASCHLLPQITVPELLWLLVTFFAFSERHLISPLLDADSMALTQVPDISISPLLLASA